MTAKKLYEAGLLTEGELMEKKLILAEKIKLLFGFCGELIPDLEILKDTEIGLEERASFTKSAAPIIMAMGMDWEEKNFELELKNRRAQALVNLIQVIKETEDERQERKAVAEKMKENLELIKGYLG